MNDWTKENILTTTGLVILFFVFFITGIIMVQFEPENPVMT